MKSGKRYKDNVLLCQSVGREIAMAFSALGFYVTVSNGYVDYPIEYFYK